ncbi:MAG: hypothetical protein NTY29_09440 [Proteobacteria bacterium]|nr:hypothetical protein [Pseudomonadota bacterium]
MKNERIIRTLIANKPPALVFTHFPESNFFVKTLGSSIFFLIIVAAFFKYAHAVPTAPNQTLIRGTVVEYAITSSKLLGIEPDQTLYRLIVAIEEVEAVNSFSNFLKGPKRQSIILYSKEKQPEDITGRKITAVIEYAGDERGGLWWIKDVVHVIK